MFKRKFTQDYYDAVDILVRDKYYDGYVCVLFDISDTFCNIDEKTAKQTIKNPYLALLGGMSLEQAQEVIKRSKK